MSAITELQAAVTANTDAISKAVTLINTLKQQVADLTAQVNDTAAIEAATKAISEADASIPTS